MAAPDGRKAGDLGRFCLIVTSSFFCCPRAADCEAGEFTNFVGKKYQFKGQELAIGLTGSAKPKLISKKPARVSNSTFPAKNYGLPAPRIREKPIQATEMQGVFRWM
jgi:hypothetical protein